MAEPETPDLFQNGFEDDEPFQDVITASPHEYLLVVFSVWGQVRGTRVLKLVAIRSQTSGESRHRRAGDG